jgi:hypothetical protein
MVLVTGGVAVGAEPDFSSQLPILAVGQLHTFAAGDCLSVDLGYTPQSFRISKSSTGVWASTAIGTTTNRPAKITTCSGENLNGSNGEVAVPIHPCEMALSGPTGAEPDVLTDDWVETIDPGGRVVLTCHYNPNERE